jgi:hypothetical protein
MTRFVPRTIAVGLVLASSLAFADAAYTVTYSTPAGKKAQKGVVKIHVAPGAGFHMNKEYPTSVSLTTVPAGVLVDKQKLTAKDATKLDETALEFEVAYTSNEAGKKVFAGDLRFAVCSASSCDPKREAVNFTVDVK